MDNGQIHPSKVAKLPNGNYLTVEQVSAAERERIRKAVEGLKTYGQDINGDTYISRQAVLHLLQLREHIHDGHSACWCTDPA